MILPFFTYFTAFGVPLLCYQFLWSGPIALVLALGAAFVLHPFLDRIYEASGAKALAGRALKHPLPSTRLAVFLFRVPLYLCFPFSVALLVIGLAGAAEHSLTDAIVAGCLLGISGGIVGIASAHELIHSKYALDRFLGQATCLAIHFPHFGIEHLLHHRHVATPNDPDSAAEGISIYQFWLTRPLLGWIQSWKFFPARMFRQTALQLLLFIAIGFLFGAHAVALFVFLGIFSVGMLKWINYIEHYGLVRTLRENGRFEPVGRHHSWDTTSDFDAISLFNLNFHTTHHVMAHVPYYELPARTEAQERRVLPFSYSFAMLLSLVPPLWFRRMRGELRADIT